MADNNRDVRLHYQQLVGFGFVIYQGVDINTDMYATFLDEEQFVQAFLKNERVNMQRKRRSGEIVTYENVKIGISIGE